MVNVEFVGLATIRTRLLQLVPVAYRRKDGAPQ